MMIIGPDDSILSRINQLIRKLHIYGRFMHKAVRHWLGCGIRKENSKYSSEELGTVPEKRTFKAPDVSEPIHTVTIPNPTEPISWGKKEDYSLYLPYINDT